MPGDRPPPPVRRRAPSQDVAADGPQRYSRAETVAIVQGAWFAATGLWPFLSMETFEDVTGPKEDRWLAKTVGGLVAVIGGALVSAGLRRRVTPELAAIGAGTAAVLAGIDVVYAARGRISPVYLGDAAAEALLIAGWASAAREEEEEDRDALPRRRRLKRKT
ncbi:MAG TPA: hypothetical protein VF541_18945 [Longimicrobium sp.]|jgi:hypothetical protein